MCHNLQNGQEKCRKMAKSQALENLRKRAFCISLGRMADDGWRMADVRLPEFTEIQHRKRPPSAIRQNNVCTVFAVTFVLMVDC